MSHQEKKAASEKNIALANTAYVPSDRRQSRSAGGRLIHNRISVIDCKKPKDDTPPCLQDHAKMCVNYSKCNKTTTCDVMHEVI